MVRFKVLFQSFKFRIRFVFGGGLAHSHFVFIIIYLLKYFNCLKENIIYTLLDTVQQQHKYMYQDSTNDMQIVCILPDCMVLSVHLHVLCNLPAVIVYVCQLLNQSMLAAVAWIVRSSICHGCSWRIDQILLNLQIVYRFLSEFTTLNTGNVHALLAVDHSLHLHVGLTLTSMKTETVLPLLTVHYCMKAICEKCLYYTISGKAN